MITEATWDQYTNAWKRRTNNELHIEKGQSISYKMKSRRSRWERMF